MGRDGDFKTRCNMGMSELFKGKGKDEQNELKGLIQNHFKYTKSTVATDILDNWEQELTKFIKVFPIDYRRVLEEEAKEKNISIETTSERIAEGKI